MTPREALSEAIAVTPGQGPSDATAAMILAALPPGSALVTIETLADAIFERDWKVQRRVGMRPIMLAEATRQEATELVERARGAMLERRSGR